MEIIGDRKFVEIPGDKTHELPPLFLKTAPVVRRLDRVMNLASNIVENEDMIPATALDAVVGDTERERRRMDLAVTLVDQYLKFVAAWQWGDGIVDWIRQCEVTFEGRAELRTLLRADIWPHAGRSSFVELLHDKHVDTDPSIASEPVDLARSVGLRLTFRQPPPISCFSDQFLFYLNSSVANSAYETWARIDRPVALPPERFTFQIVNMSLQ
ncbi:MAG: hypothetical protein ACKV2U_17030 [Bryobacteraceae bacterium]